MYAIVYKSDGFPVCQQVAGVSPDPVVTWNTEAAAKAFISSKGADADLQPVSLAEAMPPECLQRVHSPIGLDIGAVTPAEIAISILAELIAGPELAANLVALLERRP